MRTLFLLLIFLNYNLFESYINLIFLIWYFIPVDLIYYFLLVFDGFQVFIVIVKTIKPGNTTQKLVLHCILINIA